MVVEAIKFLNDLWEEGEHQIKFKIKMARRYGREPGDFGENFVERERQFRFRKNNSSSSRARSEVAEVMAYSRNGNGRPRDYVTNVSLDTSFRSDVPVYSRPKSSFEPASSSRVIRNRADDWCEVERRAIGNISSEDSEERDDDDSREEMLSYNFRPIEKASMRHSNSYGQYGNRSAKNYNYHHRNNTGRNSLLNFDEREIYFFGVVQLSPQKVQQILSKNPPPPEYAQLSPIERTAYLYYFMLYRKYLTPVIVFHRVFNREFFKYTANGDTEDLALWKICKHTHEEYKRQILKHHQEAYNKSQRRLFSDERDSPESRNSERQSVYDHDSDLNSVDSTSKEPLFYRVPHTFVRFAAGGKLVYLDPESSVSTIRVDDAKNFFLDHVNQRNIDALESFKGPMIAGRTPSQTALLFIQRQIERIRRSDVYRGNQQSGDANDCLLIWHLLEVLVRQQGKVTGPDLARLLVSDYSYSFNTPSFVRGSTDRVYESGGSTPKDFALKNEQNVDMHSMDKFTRYLLGGHVEEAIESAMQDGLLFDALFLANRVYRNDPNKLNEIETKLLRYRIPQHPVMTLMSVAGEMAVPLLANTTTDDASGWRSHIAIVLANLKTDAAIRTVYQLGLALAQKEFNSAADFCFLAVNLLKGHDCFRPPQDSDNSEGHRKHINLISASLPDVEYHSTHTRFGWSILDYQATEIFEYTQNLGTQGQQASWLSCSLEFQKCRLQYAKLLSDYGGFASNVYQYCTEIARSIWNRANEVDPLFLTELCEMANRFQYIGNAEDNSWISTLQKFIPASTTKNIQFNSASVLTNTTNVLQAGITDKFRTGHIEVPNTINFDPLHSTYTPITTSNPAVENISVAVNDCNNLIRSSRQSVASVETDSIDKVTSNFHEENHYSPVYNSLQAVSQGTPFVHNPTTREPLMNDHLYQNQYEEFNQPNQTPFIEDKYYHDQAREQFPPNNINAQQNLPVLPEVDGNFSGGFSDNVVPNGEVTDVADDDPLPYETKNSSVNGGNSNNSGGLFSGIKSRLVKYIPTSNSMNLPDDNNPQIRWDSDLGRYVGDGVEKELEVAPPPLAMPNANDAAPTMFTSSQEASSHQQQYQEQMTAVTAPPVPMIPIPTPDGIAMPAVPPTTVKKSGRLPQKRYQSGF